MTQEDGQQNLATLDMSKGDVYALQQLGAIRERIMAELAKVIVGEKQVIEEVLIAIFANGHCLLEGVPGLAKTLLIDSISKALSLSFKRIQFTPDLMPSDITGTELIQTDQATGQRVMKFMRGPIFANIVLADEINRTPPKTQAAMLEAMQEKHVSSGGTIYALPEPFFVLATQNPLEQEGTYPLPEAQQDRFLFKIFVDYPSEDEEYQIIHRVSELKFGKIEPVISGAEIMKIHELVRCIPVADTVVAYATKLVRATRPALPEAPQFIRDFLAWGCGPRASISLVSAAKAFAAMRGAPCVSCADIARVAHPVLRHRIGLNYSAHAENITPTAIVDRLLAETKEYQD